MNKYILLLLGLAVVAVHAVDGDTSPEGSTSSLQSAEKAPEIATPTPPAATLPASFHIVSREPVQADPAPSVDRAPREPYIPTIRIIGSLPPSTPGEPFYTGGEGRASRVVSTSRRSIQPASPWSLSDYLKEMLVAGTFSLSGYLLHRLVARPVMVRSIGPVRAGAPVVAMQARHTRVAPAVTVFAYLLYALVRTGKLNAVWSMLQGR